MVPMPEPTPSEFDDDLSIRSPLSAAGTRTSYLRADTPDRSSTFGGLVGGGAVGSGGGSSVGRKGGGFKPMRPVNIIQHQDAGPNNEDREEEEPVETIELPPAYTMVRSGGGGGSGPSTSTSTSS